MATIQGVPTGKVYGVRWLAILGILGPIFPMAGGFWAEGVRSVVAWICLGVIIGFILLPSIATTSVITSIQAKKQAQARAQARAQEAQQAQAHFPGVPDEITGRPVHEKPATAVLGTGLAAGILALLYFCTWIYACVYYWRHWPGTLLPSLVTGT